MTWPINALEELREAELTGDKSTIEAMRKIDFSTLLSQHRAYKAAIVKSGAITALFKMLAPRLQKGFRWVTISSRASYGRPTRDASFREVADIWSASMLSLIMQRPNGKRRECHKSHIAYLPESGRYRRQKSSEYSFNRSD